MCSNNLREGVFDSYAVDPTNPQGPGDGLIITERVDPSNPNSDGNLAEDHLPAESFRPTESLALGYNFELMA